MIPLCHGSVEIGFSADPGVKESATGGNPVRGKTWQDRGMNVDQDAVQHVLDVLAGAGVLVEPLPDAEWLYPGMAEEGPPVRVETVLSVLEEAALLHPEVRLEGWTANLVHHDAQVEQLADTLQRQVADLDRLAGPGLSVGLERVELTPTAGGLRTRARLALDGVPREADYPGHPKRLSTVLHVEIARALRATGTSRRLAWLWSDQGPWITALTATDVTGLNAGLRIDPDDPECFSWWTWVDEDAPLAAGDVAVLPTT